MRIFTIIFGAITLALISFQAGRMYQQVIQYSIDVRFAKEVFYRLGHLAPSSLQQKVDLLATEFALPVHYNEQKVSQESEALFKQFGLDDSVITKE